VSVVLKKRKN